MPNLFWHLHWRYKLIVSSYFVYILTNKMNSVFYIGMTNNLERRTLEHQRGEVPRFTKRYNIVKLVYFEEYPSAKEAITREKQLKNWHRDWKINLVRANNPEFKDLLLESQ